MDNPVRAPSYAFLCVQGIKNRDLAVYEYILVLSSPVAGQPKTFIYATKKLQIDKTKSQLRYFLARDKIRYFG